MQKIEECPKEFIDEVTRIESEIFTELNLTPNDNIEILPGNFQLDKTTAVFNIPIEYVRLGIYKKWFLAMKEELIKGIKAKNISQISSLKLLVTFVPIKLSYSVFAYYDFIGQDKKILVAGSLPEMGQKRLIKL